MEFMKLHKVCLIALLMLIVAVPAVAHNWGCWKQPYCDPYTYNYATYWSEANAALNEWANDTVLAVPRQSSHTEVSVYDGNYGATGWGGLASIESSSGCNITHCHAKVNYYYSYSSNGKRGVFCQEFGHCLGLQHSNDGGCMGGGYYYDINSYYTVVSHNISDIAAKYPGCNMAQTPGREEAALKHAETYDPQDDPHYGPGGQRLVHATWYHTPQTLRETYELAEAVVVARVADVVDHEAIRVPVDKSISEDGYDDIPNQRVHFTVNRTVKGNVGGSFELFHTGNAEFVLEGDLPYEVGQRYVLFLLPREDGSYLVTSPEGRFQVIPDGLVPSSEREFAELLRGAPLNALLGDLREIRDTSAQDHQ
jgi:hypothetical protein